jgi:peptidase M48-like protein
MNSLHLPFRRVAQHLAAFAVLAVAGAANAQPAGEAVAVPVVHAASAGQTIAEVLERSQRAQLAELQAADPSSERVKRIQAIFDRIVAAGGKPKPVELKVMRGGVQAQAMLGRLLVVGEAVGELPENELVMLLAHELGHVWLDHWQDVRALYGRHIPGAVERGTTDPVAGALGRDAHELAHKQELQADAFGFALAKRLGVTIDDATSLLMRRPQVGDTATHPATRRRLAQLRVLEMQEAERARLGPDARSAQAVTAEKTR